jgi:predicted ATPase
MNNKLLDSLQLKGFLSFAPKSEAVALTNLNVLIGPNGVGKSNFIEAIELLHATPTDLPAAIRVGGTPADWLWKATRPAEPATIETHLAPSGAFRALVYRLSFAETGNRLEVVDEAIEEAAKADPAQPDVFFYYRFQGGHPVVNVRELTADASTPNRYRERRLPRESIHPEQSVLKQKRDAEVYPELFEVAQRFERIQIFREWSFGRTVPLRFPQPANLPGDTVLPQLVNLGLVLNDLEHKDAWPRLEGLMQRFLPRFARVSTKISGGSVQIYLHEEGLKSPIPATRLSDGTLRFLALLAILLNAETASLICIEEPELGIHPDAVSLLADLLVEASATTQLIVTTHSEALVSALTDHAESVLVCDYLENGTTLHRLHTEKLKFWLKDYRLGDIWQSGKLGGNLW